jgi:MFS family permease
MIGLLEDKFYWGILSTGMVNLISTMIALKLIEFYGRRPLILYPLIIITFIMILLCIFIEINAGQYFIIAYLYHITIFILLERLAIVVLLLILIFIAMFAIGLGPIPYVYPNEVFPIDARPAAVSISMFACWVCNTCKYIFLNNSSN